MKYLALEKPLRECANLLKKIRGMPLEENEESDERKRMLEGKFPKKLRTVMFQGVEYLSEKTRAELSDALPFAGRLDYPAHDIYLRVTSHSEARRLLSCQKEPWTIQWIESCIHPGDTVFDIGANVGAYSLVMAKVTGGRAKVFAFEPAFATFSALCSNVILNHCEESIIPLPIALAAHTKFMDFNYSDLRPGRAFHWAGDDEVKNNPAYRQCVLGYALDDLVTTFHLPLPTHIKLDVDGTELEVLHGAARTLVHEGIRSLLIEVNEDNRGADRKVIQFVEALGFRLKSRARRQNRNGGSAPFSYCTFMKGEQQAPRAA
jgi:FkbM family methyltransferase